MVDVKEEMEFAFASSGHDHQTDHVVHGALLVEVVDLGAEDCGHEVLEVAEVDP